MHHIRLSHLRISLVVCFLTLSACGQASVHPNTSAESTTDTPNAAADADAVAVALPSLFSSREEAKAFNPFGNEYTLVQNTDEHEFFTDGASLEPVSFDAIVGADAAKNVLQELVATLHAGDSNNILGVRPPKGILLTGSPGVGKTYLARATATAAGVNFLITTGAAITDRNASGSPVENLRRLFEIARESAPTIVFIDELDVLGYYFSISKQLGVELDGFVANSQVYVIGAVNSLENLDSALLRAGRFDHVVHVPLPNRANRVALLRLSTQATPQDADVNFDTLSAETDGMSGADLVNFANMAALRAQRAHRQSVSYQDWDEALDDINVGPINESCVLTGDQAWHTAVHEAGHAAVATLISDKIDVRKTSLIARGPAAGYTQFMPPSEDQVLNESFYLDMLAVGLGGRAAEKLIFAQSGAGASSDLKSVSKSARRLVTEWGMGAQVGPTEFSDVTYNRRYSDHAKELIDDDAMAIINQADARAESVLRTHIHNVRRLANTLFERHQLTGAEIREILAG